MKIKIFSEDSTERLDDVLNEWIKKNPHREVQSLSIKANMMQEYFIHNPTEIANQWVQYTVVILYEMNTSENQLNK
jgi:hypothetical protein